MGDALLLTIRWLHALAAVTWVGGAAFYFFVMRPAQRAGAVPQPLARFAGLEFSSLVTLAIGTLAVTGAVLGVARLAEASAGVPYVAVLAAKVALSAWMFFLVLFRRPPARALGDQPQARRLGRVRGVADALGHVNMTLVLGVVVFLLSDVLGYLVERSLRG